MKNNETKERKPSIDAAMRSLCWAIEALPASEQQTAISLDASALLKRITESRRLAWIMEIQGEGETPKTDFLCQPREEPVYGHYTGGDPRTFHPDGECCTETEIENHKAACKLWDEAEARGETPTPEACPSGWNADHTVHVLRAPYGIGVQTYTEIPEDVPAEFARILERALHKAAKAVERCDYSGASGILFPYLEPAPAQP
jgi:hypothetical protein